MKWEDENAIESNKNLAFYSKKYIIMNDLII